jgi:hypothetical protein
MEVLSWSVAHWFELLQSVGIVCGLLFTGFALRAEKRVVGVQTLFTITEHHRSLWTQLYSRPELGRILEKKPDFMDRPITENETRFVNLLILHLFAAYRASLAGIYTTPENLGNEVGHFFVLPIPQTVWSAIKGTQDRDFVAFVDRNVANLMAN